MTGEGAMRRRAAVWVLLPDPRSSGSLNGRSLDLIALCYALFIDGAREYSVRDSILVHRVIFVHWENKAGVHSPRGCMGWM